MRSLSNRQGTPGLFAPGGDAYPRREQPADRPGATAELLQVAARHGRNTPGPLVSACAPTVVDGARGSASLKRQWDQTHPGGAGCRPR